MKHSDNHIENNGSWDAWSKHVLIELQRLNSWCKSLNDNQLKICIEIASLKVRAGFWGLFGGAIPVIIGLAIYILRSHT